MQLRHGSELDTNDDMKRNLIYHTHIQLAESIKIRTTKHDTVDTALEAISRDGMTVKCNQHTLDMILPNSASVAPKQGVKLPISFRLNKNTKEITVQCNIVSVRRLSKDIFQLEMHFKDISAKNYDEIDHYIEQSLLQHQPKQRQRQLFAA